MKLALEYGFSWSPKLWVYVRMLLHESCFPILAEAFVSSEVLVLQHATGLLLHYSDPSHRLDLGSI